MTRVSQVVYVSYSNIDTFTKFETNQNRRVGGQRLSFREKLTLTVETSPNLGDNI